MKTIIKSITGILVALTGSALLTSCSGYLVATAPPPPRTEIIIQPPTPRHVWIPGYYSYRGGTYVWIGGHYTVPPRGKSYSPGHWQKTPKGYKHNKGHWKHN